MWSMFCSCPIFFGLVPSGWIRLHQGYPDWARAEGDVACEITHGWPAVRSGVAPRCCQAKWAHEPGMDLTNFPAIENNLPCFLSGNSLFVNSGKGRQKDPEHRH